MGWHQIVVDLPPTSSRRRCPSKISAAFFQSIIAMEERSFSWTYIAQLAVGW